MAKCFECDNEAVIDHHVVPQSRGGTKTVPLCGTCHAKAHHRSGNMDTKELTKLGLANAKKNGVLLGSSRPGHWNSTNAEARIRGLKSAREISAKIRKEKADQKFVAFFPLVLELYNKSYSLIKIGQELEKHIQISRSGKWYASHIKRILDRALAGEQK